MASRSSDAVISRIASTNHNHAFALGANVAPILKVRVQKALCVGGQELHSKVHARQIPSRNSQITGAGCACGKNQSIGLGANLRQFNVLAHVSVGHKRNPLRRQDVHSSLYDVDLVGLHVGHAIHHQSTNAISPLIHCNRVPHLVKLVSSRKPCWTTANNGNTTSSTYSRRARHHPTHLIPLVDDGFFNGLNRYGVLIDAQGARALAYSRTYATGELGEVVCLEQAVQSLSPFVFVHQVVELGYKVAKRAS
mmetsp:Transcript_8067/g.12995  ORF Transcript_8067/g.12995 Transcript_8067/m.12995 type:complete len:251 (+) Transcript_8067:1694-2446(+)